MPRRELAVVCVVVLGATVAHMALVLRGWREDIPEFRDDVVVAEQAHAFLTTGRVPDRGMMASFASYTPPGSAWLFMPGLLLFSDPRLFEAPGKVLIALGTLTGVFLLARMYVGVRWALACVVLYAVSDRALYLAPLTARGSLPFFYVCLALSMAAWVRTKGAIPLTAGLVTLALGLFVQLEFAPAVFVVPAVWLAYRPRFHLRSAAAAAAVALVVWYPYLRFEASRDFVDLRSQVLRQDLSSEGHRRTLCDPAFELPNGHARMSGSIDERGAAAPRHVSLVRQIARARALVLADGLFANVNSRFPGGSVALLLVTVGGLLMAMGTVPPMARRTLPDRPKGQRRLVLAGVMLLVVSTLANELVLSALSPDGSLETGTVRRLRLMQALMALAGLALLAHRWVSRRVAAGAAVGLSGRADSGGVLAIVTLVPWVLLLLVVERSRPDRFAGLWPLQLVLLITCVIAIGISRGRSRWLGRAGQGLLAACILWNPHLASGVRDWLASGWAGDDHSAVLATNYVAHQLQSNGRSEAAIGYQLDPDDPGYLGWLAVGSDYKLGAEFDLLLRHAHGIGNRNRCAEGRSPDDEYRIVEQPIVPDEPLRYLKGFGNYDVYVRE